MLFEGSLFEHGLIGIRSFVADLDALVFQLADELVGVGLLFEFVGVFAGAVLVDEVAVLKGGEEAIGLRNGRHGPAMNAGFYAWPVLCGVFEAALVQRRKKTAAQANAKPITYLLA